MLGVVGAEPLGQLVETDVGASTGLEGIFGHALVPLILFSAHPSAFLSSVEVLAEIKYRFAELGLNLAELQQFYRKYRNSRSND